MTIKVAFTYLRTWTTSLTRYFCKYIMIYDHDVKICTKTQCFSTKTKTTRIIRSNKVNNRQRTFENTCSIISGSLSAPLLRRDARESATLCRNLKIFKCTRIHYTEKTISSLKQQLHQNRIELLWFKLCIHIIREILKPSPGKTKALNTNQ